MGLARPRATVVFAWRTCRVVGVVDAPLAAALPAVVARLAQPGWPRNPAQNFGRFSKSSVQHPVVGDLDQGLTGSIEQVANRPVGRDACDRHQRLTPGPGPDHKSQNARHRVYVTVNTRRQPVLPPSASSGRDRQPPPGVVAAGAAGTRQTGARQPTVSSAEVRRHEPVPRLVTLDDRHRRAAPNGEPRQRRRLHVGADVVGHLTLVVNGHHQPVLPRARRGGPLQPRRMRHGSRCPANRRCWLDRARRAEESLEPPSADDSCRSPKSGSAVTPGLRTVGMAQLQTPAARCLSLCPLGGSRAHDHAHTRSDFLTA